MPLDLSPLNNASRLLVEAELKVTTGGGGRFQPTGFPDLGPALYKGADGQTDWLLVESPQSMANRMELSCWDEAAECYDETCNGVPFIRSTVTVDGKISNTSTPQESHRLASPYILDGAISNNAGTPQQKLWQLLKSNDATLGLGLQEDRPFLLRNHASRLFRIDPGCLLHGVWLSTKVEPAGSQKKAICGGKVRFPRLLSACIEARSPKQANYGGIKRERVFDQAESGTTDAESGFGSIPFPRTEYTSPEIRAYFSLDLQLLRLCALGERTERIENRITRREPTRRLLALRQGNFTDDEAFLVVWSIYKIQRFLASGLTLRSGCAFRHESAMICMPTELRWPSHEDIRNDFCTLRNNLFPIRNNEGDPWRRRNVTVVTWGGTIPVLTSEATNRTDAASSTADNSNSDT